MQIMHLQENEWVIENVWDVQDEQHGSQPASACTQQQVRGGPAL